MFYGASALPYLATSFFTSIIYLSGNIQFFLSYNIVKFHPTNFDVFKKKIAEHLCSAI